MFIEGIFSLVFLIALAVFIILRWNVINQFPLSESDYEMFSNELRAKLFERAQAVGKPVLIKESFWRESGLTDAEWISLCRWMSVRGQVYLPDDWKIVQQLIGIPPTSLALTELEVQRMNRDSKPNSINIYNESGHINLGGDQIIISGQSLTSNDLAQLIEALRIDSQNLPRGEASKSRRVANSLQGVAEGRLQGDSQEAQGAIQWLLRRASEAVGNAAGNAMWATTIGALRAIGLQ